MSTITHVDSVEKTSPEQVISVPATITIHGSLIAQLVRMLPQSMTIPADSAGRTSRERLISVPATIINVAVSATGPTDHILQ